MNIERLKELKEIVYFNSWLSDKSTEDLIMMLDEAIARQSETTGISSDGFSYDVKAKQFQCLSCRDYFYMPRVGKYCPNCGKVIITLYKFMERV